MKNWRKIASDKFEAAADNSRLRFLFNFLHIRPIGLSSSFYLLIQGLRLLPAICLPCLIQYSRWTTHLPVSVIGFLGPFKAETNVPGVINQASVSQHHHGESKLITKFPKLSSTSVIGASLHHSLLFRCWIKTLEKWKKINLFNFIQVCQFFEEK